MQYVFIHRHRHPWHAVIAEIEFHSIPGSAQSILINDHSVINAIQPFDQNGMVWYYIAIYS